jgi:hypothetical protein
VEEGELAMLTRNKIKGPLSIAVLCATLVAVSALPAAAAEIEEQRTTSSIAWTAAFEYDHAIIAVSGPAGVTSWAVAGGLPLVVETAALATWAKARSLPVDGAYSYEVRFLPKVDDASRAALEQLRAAADGAETEAVGVAALPVARGHFRLVEGVIVGVDRDAPEEGATKDQVILDDLIVDGSLCVGMDCVNGESFGFDTIRLKENNLRIKFQDTSSTASFPTNDWQITANDSANGGGSYLAFEDIDGGRRPFLVEAGARTSALYVDSSGRIGFGTSVPHTHLHMWYGDTPTVRLDQTALSGWAPQTWDVAGNEANFFIRDVTNGSRLPFRIQPGAPSSALTVKASGNVGIGTWSPEAPLEIETTGETSTLLLDRTDGGKWYLSATGDGTFTIGTSAVEGDELLILDNTGNLTTSGTVNGISDRNVKRDFVPVDSAQVLDAVARLAITEWSLLGDANDVRHMGPTAQDFSAAFGLGGDERHIALSDMSGVALAAIQSLTTKLEERDREIENLSHRLRELEELVLAGRDLQ